MSETEKGPFELAMEKLDQNWQEKYNKDGKLSLEEVRKIGADMAWKKHSTEH